MRTVRELLEKKGSAVVAIDAAMSIHDAAVLMNEHKIGSVVVIETDEVHGILTERDIMTRVVAASRDPNLTLVREAMTDDVLTCSPETPLGQARQVMRDRRIRHLPVLEDGKPIGMISIGDLNFAEHVELEETIHHMEVYMSGGSL